jgi:hypothetical protein
MNWKADYGERTDWGTGTSKGSNFDPLPTDIKLNYKQWDEIELLLREIANLELVSDYDRSL